MEMGAISVWRTVNLLTGNRWHSFLEQNHLSIQAQLPVPLFSSAGNASTLSETHTHRDALRAPHTLATWPTAQRTRSPLTCVLVLSSIDGGRAAGSAGRRRAPPPALLRLALPQGSHPTLSLYSYVVELFAIQQRVLVGQLNFQLRFREYVWKCANRTWIRISDRTATLRFNYFDISE